MKNPRSSSKTFGSMTTTPANAVGRNCIIESPLSRFLRQPLPVLLLIVAAVFARLDSRHPARVVAIPVDCFAQPVTEGDLGLPTELALGFAAIDGVPQIMAGPVGDVADQG